MVFRKSTQLVNTAAKSDDLFDAESVHVYCTIVARQGLRRAERISDLPCLLRIELRTDLEA